jgi:hypothetical protein
MAPNGEFFPNETQHHNPAEHAHLEENTNKSG